MKKAVDKQNNIQRCQKKYIKKTNIIIEMQNIENTSNENTILFVIFYCNDDIFILDSKSYSK